MTEVFEDSTFQSWRLQVSNFFPSTVFNFAWHSCFNVLPWTKSVTQQKDLREQTKNPKTGAQHDSCTNSLTNNSVAASIPGCKKLLEDGNVSCKLVQRKGRLFEFHFAAIQSFPFFDVDPMELTIFTSWAHTSPRIITITFLLPYPSQNPVSFGHELSFEPCGLFLLCRIRSSFEQL